MRRHVTLLLPALLLAACLAGHPQPAQANEVARPGAVLPPTAPWAATPRVDRASEAGDPLTASLVEAVGDRRHPSAPRPPSTTCATIPAQLSMPGRTASAAEEASPPDTARIQRGLDACAGTGGAVRLSTSGAATDFLSGPLVVRPGEVLLVDPAATLFASRNAAAYQVAGHGRCGTIGGDGLGCAPFLAVGSGSGVESTRAADGTQGRIDGRGDATLLGSATTWWALSAQAKAGGNQNVPRLIKAQRSNDVTVADVDLIDSPGQHISFNDGVGLTVWGVVVFTPANARNTDGIDPAGAQDVTIADSYIMDGDDGIAIKASDAPSAHITIRGNTLTGTHGISLGRQTTAGISDVLIDGNTISGKDRYGNQSVAAGGIRIKSSAAAGGLVRDITFRDTCIDLVKAPVVFDSRYESGSGTHIPSFTGIVVDGLRATNSVKGAASVLEGFDAAHPLGLLLRRVDVDDPDVRAAYADITTQGAHFGGVPFTASGAGVRVTAQADAGAAPACG